MSSWKITAGFTLLAGVGGLVAWNIALQKRLQNAKQEKQRAELALQKSQGNNIKLYGALLVC